VAARIQTRYAGPAVWLHWSMAGLVVVVGILGLLHDSWSRDTQGFWINLHALLGLLIFALLGIRIAWRVTHPPPELPAHVGSLSRVLAHAVHLLIYLLLAVIPVLGIITFIWHGRAFDFGAFTIDFGVAKNRAIFHPTEDWHGYLAYALFALAGLHVLAALWHHFARRDGVLQRMWFPGPMR
jgi:cytochrome b561